MFRLDPFLSCRIGGIRPRRGCAIHRDRTRSGVASNVQTAHRRLCRRLRLKRLHLCLPTLLLIFGRFLKSLLLQLHLLLGIAVSRILHVRFIRRLNRRIQRLLLAVAVNQADGSQGCPQNRSNDCCDSTHSSSPSFSSFSTMKVVTSPLIYSGSVDSGVL